jgi:TfoX/Sxy family transcriptional regulator of competence genes
MTDKTKRALNLTRKMFGQYKIWFYEVVGEVVCKFAIIWAVCSVLEVAINAW